MEYRRKKKLKNIVISWDTRKNVSDCGNRYWKNKKRNIKDLSFLVNQWNKIRELTLKSEAPEMIHEEGNVLKRAIRDMLSEDVDKILVEGKEGSIKSKKLLKT